METTSLCLSGHRFKVFPADVNPMEPEIFFDMKLQAKKQSKSLWFQLALELSEKVNPHTEEYERINKEQFIHRKIWNYKEVTIFEEVVTWDLGTIDLNS